MSRHDKSQGLIEWFINNHVAANIIMMLLVIGGIISVKAMRTETFPSIDPKIITVSVAYPGATPYEVADAITSRVEEDLIGIEGVKRVSSTASEGMGVITAELLDFANADDAYNDIETAVNSLIDFPPENAERPIIKKIRVTPNVLTLAIHGSTDEQTIKYWSETIEDEIRQIPGVAVTTLRGIREYQISIEVSEADLQKYGLTFEAIAQSVRAHSADIPAGTIESAQGDILLRIQEKRYRGEEFEQIVIRTRPDGSVLLLGEVAKVIDGFEDANLISKFNGQRAAFLDIKRSDSEDTLTVADAVKEYIETVELPPGLELSIQVDETSILKDRIRLMLKNGLIGFVLVFCILLLFLDLKLAFWTSAAIPISFLGGLMLLQFLGFSLNMVSLFGLIVVLGIVVDDGIVMGESIFEAQKRAPSDPHAVKRGVSNVLAPVTIGVATTMAAFAPLIFSTGTIGQVVSIIPVVVISILFISLMEAYFILPSHLSTPGTWSRGIMADIRDTFSGGMERCVDQIIAPLIAFCLRWRYATLAGFISVTLITFSLLQGGIVKFIFFPAIEGDQITINIEMPLGTPFDTTSDTVLAMEHEIHLIRQQLQQQNSADIFETVSVSIGEKINTISPMNINLGNSASHLGQIKINLVPSDFRDQSASDVERLIRKKIESMPNVETLEFQSSLIGDEADIEIELTHPDEKQLSAAAEQLKQQVASINGTKEVSDSFEPGKTEYVFKLNAQGFAVGLTPAELGRQLRSAYFGLEALRFQRGRSEMIVYIRYPKNQRENLATLSETRIRLKNGQEVPLASVTEIMEQNGFSQILSVNGRRIVNISTDVDTSITTPSAVMSIIQTELLPTLQNQYHGLKFSFEGESRDQQEDMASLGRNMMIALLLIYVMLGAQLRSYVQPFVIMSAIPFGATGAILGHLILGYNLSFISMFGLVALTGVVVNNSVVLVDYLNSHLRAGKTIADSTIIAVKRRFRPIALTTLSTSLGLLPILLETSMQARFLIPMVVSLAMGILFSTLVVLFCVPCLIVIVEDVKSALAQLKARFTSKTI